MADELAVKGHEAALASLPASPCESLVYCSAVIFVAST